MSKKRSCENLRRTWFEDEAVFVRSDVFSSPDMSTAQAESFRTNSGNGQSVSSSFARFTIVKDQLYILSDDVISSFNISNPALPIASSITSEIIWGAETIYPFQNNLFVGARNGMTIYSLSNPESPQRISEFSHATGCDPVVADDRTAFVTIRDGNNCGGNINQLDVIDVTNISNPQLISSHRLENPRGLTFISDRLYVCDGTEGVISFVYF